MSLAPGWRLRSMFVENKMARVRQFFAGESRHQLLVSIGALAGSGLIAVAIRFIGGIIQGRFVGPETLGYYSKFTILPDFLFFLHLGVFTSLARQYPFYIGKGDRELALRYAANALGWTWILCVLHAVIFLIPCVWCAILGDWRASLGWGTQSILTVTSLYMVYLGSTYRNSNEFVDWSRANLVSSVASLFALPLVAFYQFAGLCIRYSVPTVISSAYAHWKRPLRISFQLDGKVLGQMIAFGAPLMVFAYIQYQLTDSITRSVIVKEIGEKALGVYTYAGTLCVALTTVATSISQVFNPRLAMRFGSTESIADTFGYCVKCTLTGTAVMLPIIGLTWWLIDPTVRWLLPKYVECIPVTRWLCWLSLIPVIDLPKQLLMVAKHTREYGLSVIAGFLVLMGYLGLYSYLGRTITLRHIVIAVIASKLSSVLLSDYFAWRLAVLELKDRGNRPAASA